MVGQHFVAKKSYTDVSAVLSHALLWTVQKVHRFTKCSDCETMRQLLAAHYMDKFRANAILKQHEGHIDMMQRERAGDLACHNPDDSMSIILDGVDQKAFVLRHFLKNWKDVTGEGMKVKIMGVKEHLTPSDICLYLMTDEYETGANPIEELHRTLVNKSSNSVIPPVLFVQADKCTRENKNMYFLSDCESLVAWDVLREVCVSFLPKGHMHEDVDQIFSETDRALRILPAFTLDGMARILRESYNTKPTGEVLDNMINWSALPIFRIRSFERYSCYRYRSV